MKFLSILAAVSLALAPAISNAGSSTDGTSSDRPISGPLAGRVLNNSEVPVGAIVIGTLVIFGGVLIGVLAGGNSDSNNNTNSKSD